MNSTTDAYLEAQPRLPSQLPRHRAALHDSGEDAVIETRAETGGVFSATFHVSRFVGGGAAGNALIAIASPP